MRKTLVECEHLNTGGGRRESPFAHLGVEPGTWKTLCGYVPVRRGRPGEARRKGVCVVCAAIYEERFGRPWDEPNRYEDQDGELSLPIALPDEEMLALLRGVRRDE